MTRQNGNYNSWRYNTSKIFSGGKFRIVGYIYVKNE